MWITSKSFLVWGGWTLLILGVLGFIFPNIGGEYLNFSKVENWAHALLGILALTIGYGIKDNRILKAVSIIFGVAGLIFGIWGFIVAGNPSPNFYGDVNLNNPIDNIIHLTIAVWALITSKSRHSSAVPQTPRR
ncbi:MAG: hypothetical protein AAB847_01565 [Patescibacteria group bacterium]